MKTDDESPMLSPDRLWAFPSLIHRVLWALFLHEAYHLPESSAKTMNGWSLEHSSLCDANA
jgi:hypothetical protein